VPLPRSRTPAESTIPRLLTVPSMLPPLVRQRRLQRINHIGAIARLQHLLPTLQEWCCHRPCKARFRPAGSPLPGGSRTLWITTKGFRSLSRPPLLDLSWRNVRRVFPSTAGRLAVRCRRPAELAGATGAAERRWHCAVAMSAERHRALEMLAGSWLAATKRCPHPAKGDIRALQRQAGYDQLQPPAICPTHGAYQLRNPACPQLGTQLPLGGRSACFPCLRRRHLPPIHLMGDHT
jgi:hypothetical protein